MLNQWPKRGCLPGSIHLRQVSFGISMAFPYLRNPELQNLPLCLCWLMVCLLRIPKVFDWTPRRELAFQELPLSQFSFSHYPSMWALKYRCQSWRNGWFPWRFLQLIPQSAPCQVASPDVTTGGPQNDSVSWGGCTAAVGQLTGHPPPIGIHGISGQWAICNWSNIN